MFSIEFYSKTMGLCMCVCLWKLVPFRITGYISIQIINNIVNDGPVMNTGHIGMKHTVYLDAHIKIELRQNLCRQVSGCRGNH